MFGIFWTPHLFFFTFFRSRKKNYDYEEPVKNEEKDNLAQILEILNFSLRND